MVCWGREEGGGERRDQTLNGAVDEKGYLMRIEGLRMSS